jgi:hypothetical protein
MFASIGRLSTFTLIVAATSLDAQVVIRRVSVTLNDINPNQSSLDASDPDGASGGRVNGLGRAANGTTYYAATEWGGIYRSTDAGLTWSHVAGHVPMATWDVEVDPTNVNRVYATSFYDGKVASISGISVSTDGGVTWIHPASATPPAGFCVNAARRDEPSAFGIAIDPANAQNVYVGTNCGLAVSTNAGVNWTFVDPTPANGADDIWSVIVHHGGIIDVCGDDGHRRSTNGGVTWTGPTGTGLGSGRCSLAVSPDEANVLYAVRGVTIMESFNGGGSWSAFAPANPNGQGRIPFVRTNKRTSTTYDLWFGDVSLYRVTCTTPATPTNTTRCAGPWTGGFTRNSGGHDDVGDLVFNTAVTTDACPVMFASDGGVYRNLTTATPGCHSPTWEQPNVSPHALWLYAMDGAPAAGLTDEDMYVGAQDNGIFGTLNAGALVQTWINAGCCDGFSLAAAPTRVVYTQCCYGGGVPNRLFIAGRGFTGGTTQPNPYPTGGIFGWIKAGNVVRFSATGYAVVTGSGVFITNNIGASPTVWTQLGATPPPGAVAVKVSVAAGTPTFYAQSGSADGRGLDLLWRFNGTATTGTWTQVQPPGNLGGFGVFDVDPNDPNRLIASHLRPSADPQMIMSTNGGATWTNLTALDGMMTAGGWFKYRTTRGVWDWSGFVGYPQPSLVAFDPDRPNWILAGATDAGVFLSIDGGTNWTRLTDPFTPGTSGTAHLPRPLYAYFDHEGSTGPTLFGDSARIFVGTQGRGVWRIDRYERINVITFCNGFARCGLPELFRGGFVLTCLEKPCFIRDPLPRNCLVKFNCPGCERAGLCPAFQNIFLDGLDLNKWDVGLYGRRGDPVDFQLTRTRRGVVISFRPDSANYVDGRIGDYELGFFLKPGAPPGRYRVNARLTVSDKPYGAEGLERAREDR